MSVYTRTGDNGTTSLFGGKRVLKCDELVDVYGSIDELNSWVGLISSSIPAADVQKFLNNIQSDLFTIGSLLAGWKGEWAGLKSRIQEMEARIDHLEGELNKINNFIIPGGSMLSSQIHITRSICRRVERQMIKLSQSDEFTLDEKVKKVLFMYLNRLSDLFFVLARFINKLENKPEYTWSGIKNK